MVLPVVRRIRDNLHGSIDITELEDAVIAHPFFQRLRRVRQLAFLHYVFPGATHTRFEHSLGVMHLAGISWEKLKANQERLRMSLERSPDFAQGESTTPGGISHGRLFPTFALMDRIFASDYALQCFRLAGLLHDVGHPPFSHSGEHFMPSWDEVRLTNPDMADYIADYIDKKLEEGRAKGGALPRVRHEIYSILLIEKILKYVYATPRSWKMTVDPRDVIAIINPAISPAPHSPLLAENSLNLLRELISGELDIDRMDYLLRDSRECGVVYGVFDVDRILDSLCLYYDDNDQQTHVAINLSGLAAFEDYLRARYSMYLQLYFHKSSVAAEAMMWNLCERLQDWRLPGKAEKYAAIDEYNIGPALWEAAHKLPEEERESVRIMVADLLYNRKLWKRVFEVSGPRDQLSRTIIEEAEAILKAEHIAHQEISSANSLTRFQPRNGSARSHNSLRLIKKDERQIPRVCPIEDYSSLIASNDSVAIVRIYAAPRETASGADTLSVQGIRDLLTQRLQSPHPRSP